MARCVIVDDDHRHDGRRCELTERHVYKWHGIARASFPPLCCRRIICSGHDLLCEALGTKSRLVRCGSAARVLRGKDLGHALFVFGH